MFMFHMLFFLFACLNLNFIPFVTLYIKTFVHIRYLHNALKMLRVATKRVWAIIFLTKKTDTVMM